MLNGSRSVSFVSERSSYTYLLTHPTPSGRSFVRKRSSGGFAAFGLTTVKQLETGQRVELKQVSEASYVVLWMTSISPVVSNP